jgi:hypothetical protein
VGAKGGDLNNFMVMTIFFKYLYIHIFSMW